MSNILFFLSHQPDPKVIKQILFLSQNNNISVVYFSRNSLSNLYEQYQQACVLDKEMGNISNGNYMMRIVNYLKSLSKLFYFFKKHDYDIIIVNNIDILALYKLVNIFSKVENQIVMEISDLNEYVYNNNMKSKLIRYFERKIFKYVDKLVITSPLFYSVYYKFFFPDKPFLLENKLLTCFVPNKLPHQSHEKIIIGIVGMLFQEKPYEALFKVIGEDENLEVHIYGKGKSVDLIKKYVNKYKNIKYFGEYNFLNDIAQIYASFDILYISYDTSSNILNNRVALPNKLYEAMYFKTPVIVSKDTYLAKIVSQYNLGLTIQCCDKKDIYLAIENINTNIEQFEESFEKLQKDMYLLDNDLVMFEQYLRKLR